MAGLLQTCLLLGVFIPLLSFAFLAFFGSRLGRRPAPAHADRHGHGGHHGHESEHGHHVTSPGPGEPLAGWIATSAIAISFILALVVVVVWGGVNAQGRSGLSRAAADAAIVWVNLGSMPIEFGVKLDSLTIVMFLMVSLCATCIHIFSIGYMAGDKRFARFFTYLSLFCFSMLGLVISTNILFLFIFWELVGACSYFLIGFWFEKRSASNAAIKAFVTNRVGDFGFMIGLGLCVAYLGTLSLDGAAAVFEAAAHHAGWAVGATSEAARLVPPEQALAATGLFNREFLGVALATWMGVGLFCGAVGKSAQFPLHVWLPDAMEGPTPVSALIHAATMVAAGVYLVARVYLLLTPGAQFVIAVIGCITLTMAALLAIVQVDIKRVLAYSTLSQLGYMIFGLGVGAWIGALFHLLTHAFFKALLFLGSGQVIAGCHHEQDIRKMGGLWGKMPKTGLTFLIAVLAISGAGIPWTPLGLGGFYSKDEILAVAQFRAMNWSQAATGMSDEHAGREIVLVSQESHPERAAESHAGGHDAAAPAAHGAARDAHNGHEISAASYPRVKPLPWIMLLLPMIVAYITPFYMGRCFVLTFLGKPRDRQIHEHAHESPILYVPLLILGLMTVVSGWFLFRGLVADAAPHLSPLVPAVDGNDHALHGVHTLLPMEVGFAWVVGLGVAWLLYRDGLAIAERLARAPLVRPIHQALWNKLYFDEVYGFALVGGTKVIAVVSRLFDNWIIDGAVNTVAYLGERISRFSGVVLDNMGVDGLVNMVGRVCQFAGGMFRSVQTGVIRNYVLFAALVVSGAVLSIWDVITAVVFVAVGIVLVLLPRQPRGGLLAGER